MWSSAGPALRALPSAQHGRRLCVCSRCESWALTSHRGPQASLPRMSQTIKDLYCKAVRRREGRAAPQINPGSDSPGMAKRRPPAWRWEGSGFPSAQIHADKTPEKPAEQRSAQPGRREPQARLGRLWAGHQNQPAPTVMGGSEAEGAPRSSQTRPRPRAHPHGHAPAHTHTATPPHPPGHALAPTHTASHPGFLRGPPV